MFLITPKDVEKETIAQGIARRVLDVPIQVFLTFNQAILEELQNVCALKEWNWPGGKYGPYYSSYKGWKGLIDAYEIGVFFPPMGASSISTFCEDLIHYGARTIFLLCASWGLGTDYLKRGQIHLPNFAIGMDGTSFHYGNKKFRIDAEPRAFAALTSVLDKMAANWKHGGVGACEAFYRITPKLVNYFRKKGCLSMENGEVAALYSLAREYDINVGVLLQPYIDLEQGWKLDFMDATYKETCRLQARAAIEAVRIL